jgi:hypothetical protein
MGGKLLFIINSGLESPSRVHWGLRMALNIHTHPYGEKILDEVKVLLFCGGVGIVDPASPHSQELSERLIELVGAGVEVVSCVSIAGALGLEEETTVLGIKLVHASIYVAERVSEGYEVINF